MEAKNLRRKEMVAIGGELQSTATGFWLVGIYELGEVASYRYQYL